MFYPCNYQYHIVRPDPGAKYLNQIHECIDGIRKIKDQEPGAIVRISWFYRRSENLTCNLIREYISFSGTGRVFSVAPAFIAQSPTDGSDMQVMVVVLDIPAHVEVSYRHLSGIRYAVVEDGANKWVYASGSECTSPALSCRKQSRNTFSLVKDILTMEKLSFHHIIRQWNYIGDILEQEVGDHGLIQNYQEFNEIRSEWYLKDGFESDYPAATGIGTRGGGIRIDFIAASLSDDLRTVSLKNPFQQDAHRYSEDQLVGDNPQSRPKFERGKLIHSNQKGYIWVSGTAAIRGEQSVQGTALEQAAITCENIAHLISPENMTSSGLEPTPGIIEPVYIRGYVKHHDDGPGVLQFLKEQYPATVVHVLQADVCRNELLVEIEGEFLIKEFIK